MTDAYKQAGVDVVKGYESVKRIQKHVTRTNRKEVLGRLGSFAGLFDLTSLPYKEPVLVSGTDGVGTKLMLAVQQQTHDTVGIDLVAMCVNDIIAQGADPLFFLDYIGCGKNNPAVIEEIVSGIAEGCVQAGAALIGGETAEMPGMYKDDEYDLAGFAVGITEKSEMITGDTIQEGDVIIGLPSSGIHSNGFSLVRKLIKNLDLAEIYDPFVKPLGEILLTPTKIYVKQIRALKSIVPIKGIAHITGGGFYENFPRMLPEGLGVSLDQSCWKIPPIFPFLQKLGKLQEKEMYGIFNMGIGMALVVQKEDVDKALTALQEIEEAKVIGKVIKEEGVHFINDM